LLDKKSPVQADEKTLTTESEDHVAKPRPLKRKLTLVAVQAPPSPPPPPKKKTTSPGHNPFAAPHFWAIRKVKSGTKISYIGLNKKTLKGDRLIKTAGQQVRPPTPMPAVEPVDLHTIYNHLYLRDSDGVPVMGLRSGNVLF
jgi:hypothetical protein